MSRLPFGRWIAAVAVPTALILMGLATLAAGPSQEGIPPQPYGANFFPVPRRLRVHQLQKAPS